MLMEATVSLDIDIVYGPTVSEMFWVSALEETIGETNEIDKKEKARKAIKTPMLDRLSLFFDICFRFMLTS
jgi:hypothetical protein